MELGDKDRREPGLYDAPIDYERVANVYDLYVTSDLDIGFYVEEATKVQGKVLELMCGNGRVSIPLLEAGVDLTCVDASAGMLARLDERLRARKLEFRTKMYGRVLRGSSLCCVFYASKRISEHASAHSTTTKKSG
jgi:SAM-dependent methyltransferase